ncbi:RNA polymerase sigma factor [Oceanirhabdus seepicola]|uniref:Sigma-70 family RNA polymerase sigma factor n=1 Tax=Oceanirhabdus seepicola TaxID=2828781 RepID=A0A9J6NVU1_9CLOT|nr:RNA polymerase sigma factor [Oceanirhabdus seepicola]MCM1988599.1 sigma-70 family RNA polymerase sigma factor [Oceanirhabdus seepicola]
MEKKLSGDELYEEIKKHKSVLYGVAFKFFRNEDDSLEALQETAFRAYKNRKNIKDLESIRAWLIKITTNYCINEIKKRRRMISVDKVREDEEINIGLSQEEKMYIRECIMNLKEPYREVIMLRFFEDLKIKDIGIKMDKPQNTVRTWLYRGIKMLGNKMEEDNSNVG